MVFILAVAHPQSRFGVGVGGLEQRFGVLWRHIAVPVSSLLSLAGIFLVFLAPGPVSGQSDATWINGSGNWSLIAPSWNAGAVWVNGDNAIFNGTGETVELGSVMTVNNLTFNGNGFLIQDSLSAGSLSLAGPSVISVTDAAHTATIGDGLPSGALTKAGAGTLVLSGTNAFDGAVAVSAGRLTAASNWALGTTAGATSVASGAQLTLADGVTIAGESLTIAGSGLNFSGALNAAANATAAWGGTVSVTSGARVGTEAGGLLTISGVVSGGPLVISAYGSGADTGTVVLSNTGNLYTGDTQIFRGQLRLGAANALPTGTTLNVGAAATSDSATFDLAGHNQVVGGLTRSTTHTGGSFVTNSGAGASTLTVNLGGVTTTTYSGILQDGTGVLNFVKSGSSTSTLTLSGNNTHSGTTTVSGGTLSLAGASSATGQFVVNSGAVLWVSHDQGLGSASAGTVVNDGGRLTLAGGVTVTGEPLSINGNGGNNNGAIQTADGTTATWAGDIVLTGTSRMGGGAGGTLIVDGVISGPYGVLFSRGNNATTVLNAVNTYTGDTQMFAGGGTRATLKMGADNAISPLSQYSTIGATATKPMDLDLNGHVLTLRALNTFANPANGAQIFILNNGLSPSVFTVSGASGSTNFTGILADGSGGLSLVKDGASTQVLVAPSTYTGSTTIKAGVLQIGGSVDSYGSTGTLASPQYDLLGGTLALDNLGASNNAGNRLPDASVLSFQGGSLLFKGSDQAATNSSETVGTLDFDRSLSLVTTRFGGSNIATLTTGQLARSAGEGLGFVNGANLGRDATSTGSVARLLVTNAPTLVGTTDATSTGINASVQNTKIVPFLLGSATAVSGGLGTEAGTPNTFVTYEPGTGLRPLNPVDEFSSSLTGGNNVRMTATVLASSSVSINSLILDGAGVNLDIASGQTVTVASGAVLFSSGLEPRLDGPGTLDFGTREGLVTINSSGNTFITAPIAGSAGVSYHGTGTLVLGGQQNSYSGDTVLRVSNVIPQSSSQGPAGAPTSGPFGTGTVIFDGSAIRATTGTDITIGNPAILRADTTILSGSSKNVIFTGPVTLESGTRTIQHQSSADTIFSGVIGDAGQSIGLTVSGTGTGKVILEAANTYTGATTVSGATLSISSEENLGANPASPNGAQLHLNGGILETTGTFAFDDANRGVTVGASGGTILTAPGTSLTVANDAVLSGNLTKAGTGTLLLNGSSSGTGTVTVSEGTLGGGGTIAGDTTVQSGATLTAGTMGGVGLLTFGGDLTTGSGSVWLVNFVSGLADFTDVSGGLITLGGAIHIVDDGSWVPHQSYDIASYSSLSGAFSNAATSGAQVGNFFLNYGSGTDGVITLTAIPEPETWLPVLCLLALGSLARRRRQW